MSGRTGSTRPTRARRGAETDERQNAALKSLATTTAGWLLVVVLVGCEGAPIYTEGDRRWAIGQVPDRSLWEAHGTMASAGQAIDGNIHTAAVAGEADRSASLVVDLGKPGTLNMVVVDHGRNEFGFARQVEVHTSLDGKRFTRRLVGLGTRRVSTFLLISPVLARYVRLDAVVVGDRPWSLAEIHLQ